MKKLYGKLSISRDSGNIIRIEVEDSLSSNRVAEVHLTPESLAMALTGLSDVPMVYQVFDSHAGMKREVKTEVIPLPEGCDGMEFMGDKFPIYYRQMVEPYENYGWIAEGQTKSNGHRRTRDGYRVNFVRYVDPSAEMLAKVKEEHQDRSSWMIDEI